MPNFKNSFTLCALCLIALCSFAQQPDKYEGKWKQTDGNIRVEIKKEKGKPRYSSTLTMDSLINRVDGIHILDGGVFPVQFFPLQEESVKFKYDEKTKMLIGYWSEKKKTVKLVKY